MPESLENDAPSGPKAPTTGVEIAPDSGRGSMAFSVGAILIAFVVWVAFQEYRERRASQLDTVGQMPFIVDLNRATEAELKLIPGIGEKLARDIIAYRLEHCSFHTPEDLMKVPGIRRTRFEQFKPYVSVATQE